MIIFEKNQLLPKTENPLQDLLNAYFTGRSKRTIEAYQADLKGFSNYLNLNEYENGVLHLLQASAGEANRLVLMFKNWMIDSGLASNTINRRLASIRSLVKLARSLGMVSFEIEIQNLKVTLLRDTRGPQNFEIQKVFKYLKSKNSAKATRDIAIFRLLFDLALRASELIYIDLSDFDQNNKIIYIVGKGMREKTPLSLPEPTFQAVIEWLKVRGSFPGALIGNFKRGSGKGGRLSRQGLRDLVMEVAIKSGIDAKTTHSWRHSSITQAIIKAQENGLGLELVLDHSRHSKNSLNLLMTYRDRYNNVQGKIADLVSKQMG